MILPTVWFLIWGLLWGVYFLLDGFDLGAGILQPAVARNQAERQAIYRAVGPFWDGNEVWLITAGGVTFAAFPGAYATLFSALYSPLMLLLFALILRGAALGLKSEVSAGNLKKALDTAFVGGSWSAAFLFGVIFTGLFSSLPLDGEGRLAGSWFSFYTLLGGIFFCAFFSYHGLIWLRYMTRGEVQARAEKLAGPAFVGLALLTVLLLLASAFQTRLYDQYLAHPFLFIVPAAAALCLVLSRFFLAGNAVRPAFLLSGLFILGVVFFGLLGIFPALVPSSLDPEFSVTIHNSAASPLTLKIMLGVAAVFVPLVLFYQGWVYKVFKNSAGADDTKETEMYH